jgi:P27 family predicted phage terminase small subunit
MPRGRTGSGGPKEGHRREPNELARVVPNPTPIDLPEPPRHLDEDLHDGWYVILEDLAGRGRNPAALQPVDTLMVEQLLEQVWVHQQATEVLRIEGTMIYRKAEIRGPGREPTGEFVTLDAKAHPAVKMQRDASLAYLRLADRLGLTPMARVQAGLMIAATKSLAQTFGEQLGRVIEAEAQKSLPAKKPAAVRKKPAATEAPATKAPVKKAPGKRPSTKGKAAGR